MLRESSGGIIKELSGHQSTVLYVACRKTSSLNNPSLRIGRPKATDITDKSALATKEEQALEAGNELWPWLYRMWEVSVFRQHWPWTTAYKEGHLGFGRLQGVVFRVLQRPSAHGNQKLSPSLGWCIMETCTQVSLVDGYQKMLPWLAHPLVWDKTILYL